MSRELENKARVTIGGRRYRMGNPNHPFNDLYEQEGAEAVYRKMGLLDDDYDVEDPAFSGLLKAMTGLGIAIVGVTLLGVYLG